MMKRLLELRVSVYAVLHDDTITKNSYRSNLDISDDFWRTMEEVPPILEPFAEATEVG